MATVLLAVAAAGVAALLRGCHREPAKARIVQMRTVRVGRCVGGSGPCWDCAVDYEDGQPYGGPIICRKAGGEQLWRGR